MTGKHSRPRDWRRTTLVGAAGVLVVAAVVPAFLVEDPPVRRAKPSPVVSPSPEWVAVDPAPEDEGEPPTEYGWSLRPVDRTRTVSGPRVQAVAGRAAPSPTPGPQPTPAAPGLPPAVPPLVPPLPSLTPVPAPTAVPTKPTRRERRCAKRPDRPRCQPTPSPSPS